MLDIHVGLLYVVVGWSVVVTGNPTQGHTTQEPELEDVTQGHHSEPEVQEHRMPSLPLDTIDHIVTKYGVVMYNATQLQQLHSSVTSAGGLSMAGVGVSESSTASGCYNDLCCNTCVGFYNESMIPDPKDPNSRAYIVSNGTYRQYIPEASCGHRSETYCARCSIVRLTRHILVSKSVRSVSDCGDTCKLWPHDVAAFCRCTKPASKTGYLPYLGAGSGVLLLGAALGTGATFGIMKYRSRATEEQHDADDEQNDGDDSSSSSIEEQHRIDDAENSQ